jgi:hypothetical protein
MNFQTWLEDRKKGQSLADQKYPYRHVVIYRAVLATTTTFKPMDCVTRSLRWAKEHCQHIAAIEEEPAHVIQAMVKSTEVFDAYNPGEYFYDGPEVAGKTIWGSTT